MVSDTDVIDQSERIPRLAAGTDLSSVPRSAQEGYLLSRVDGCTPWSALREIGGMPAEWADALLEGWLAVGFLTLESGRPAAPRRDSAEEEIDPSLDLSEELQRRILEFDAALENLDYFQLLGVERSADARRIKRAYFALSREFHPDRYFRRRTGGFAERLDRIFQRIVEAYELLHDPATRAEVERNLAATQTAALESKPKSGSPDAKLPAPSATAAGSRMQHLSRLRDSFRPRAGVSAESRWKACRFYQAAGLSLEAENFLEAAANARLAIAFDPSEEAYRLGFAEIQAEVHRLRARDLLQRASSVGAQAEALELLEEAIHYRPGDVAVSGRAARLALSLGDSERALSHAQHAAALEPEREVHHLLCSRVLRRLGDFEAAGDALGRAALLGGGSADVAAEREHLERRARG